MVTEEEFKKLSDEVKELKQLFEKHLPKLGEIKIRTTINEDKIQKLANDAGITLEKIKAVFDFGPEDLNLISLVTGKNEEEKQLKATLCVLTGYNHCYNSDSILSQKIRLKLEKLGIKSLANLSTNLANYPNYIVCNIEKGSKASSYKITYPGIKRGLEIIKDLAQ